jgi:hypothetical protein
VDAEFIMDEHKYDDTPGPGAKPDVVHRRPEGARDLFNYEPRVYLDDHLVPSRG